MNISIIINDDQKKFLIKESVIDELGLVLKNNFESVKEILSESKKQMGVNLEFLLTWGASIGGFVGPLNQFIEGRFPELNRVQIISISIGIIATFFLDNKETVKKILKKIKEDSLEEEFLAVFNKAKELKAAFLDFIESLNLTFGKVTNMMTYAFIIPLLDKILNFTMEQSPTDEDIKQLVLRISSFGLLTIGGVALNKLIKNLIKRFRSYS